MDLKEKPESSSRDSKPVVPGGILDVGLAANSSMSSSNGTPSRLAVLENANFANLTDKDFLCPICFETIKEAFMTKCGHSFCYLCIVQHLEHKKTCPTCGSSLQRENIYPNFLLNRLLEKTTALAAQVATPSPVKHLQQCLLADKEWSVADINNLLGTLLDKKRKLEADEKEVEIDVLLDFLLRTKQQKQEALNKTSREIELLNEDIDKVEGQRKEIFSIRDNSAPQVPQTSSKKRSFKDVFGVVVDSSETALATEGISLLQTAATGNPETIATKKRRIHTHLEDLQACYFDARRSGKDSLKHFTESLSRFTKYSRFRVLASLKYGDIFNTSSIVSSIEFDRDDEYFATAGVTKKIKIFEYNTIVHDPVDVHYPVREMACRSKISCLSWNSYIKSQIASSDYEGIITLWDAHTGQTFTQFEEHEKRAWSVDFCRTDPTRLASGSDDTKVKLWSTNQDRSVATIESKANICCVKFNPESSNHLAFGSADHHIHYYDLRNFRDPLFVFKGHRKAVSYVKFLSRDEIVSASTDSTLKLWNINQSDCVRNFTGHTNEKNFVGLTACGEYIACGSENNGVYTYYKTLSKPVVQYKFGAANPVTGEESDEDASQFVSSVCWRKNSAILLAANSQGTIKVLELV